VIVLLGVAGAGKSTQGKLLADQKGYAWLSSGEILRVLITGTRRQEMLKGKLLSDEEMIEVFDKVFDLIDPNDEFVLDGFPRTVKQLKWIFEQEAKQRVTRIIALNLYADEKVVHDRLLKRGRVDDNEDEIAKRFEEYRKSTLPIIAELKKHKVKVFDIDASNGPEEIHKNILKIINDYGPAVIPTKQIL
jgi:adenylate kinase